jgi:hypothetical protein
MRGPIFILLLVLMALAAMSAPLDPTLAQGTSSADPRTRCAQLIAFWMLHSGAKSEGSGGADVPRKSAEVDCEAGRYDKGIKTMEDLLRRNGYTPPP